MLFLLMNPNYTNYETKQLLTEFSFTVYNEIKLSFYMFCYLSTVFRVKIEVIAFTNSTLSFFSSGAQYTFPSLRTLIDYYNLNLNDSGFGTLKALTSDLYWSY